MSPTSHDMPIRPLLKLDRIEKVFFTDELETHALSTIQLEVKTGEYVAIEGPSGSGKTTLLSILGLLDVPTSGEYRFAGPMSFRDVLRKLIPWKQPDHRAAGLEEGNDLSGCTKFPRKAERLIERDAFAHVGDAERDHGEPRNRCLQFVTHLATFSSVEAPLRVGASNPVFAWRPWIASLALAMTNSRTD